MKEENFNTICITKIAATIARLLDVEGHQNADTPISEVTEKAAAMFAQEKCDRVFMYNPDAISMWLYEKYNSYYSNLLKNTDLKLAMLSVMPSITPVCFASMYSGMQPALHGIRSYVKPVLTVETVFDDMIKAGKRVAIVSTKGDSISKIFLNRKMDYFIYFSMNKCNRKAQQLIKEDKYDLILLYNRNYDFNMHIHSPEGKTALRALRNNIDTYNKIIGAIKENWKNHNTVAAFAPDHGCHEIDGHLGSHGLNVPEDMNIMHFYSFLQKEKK